jgi:putative FmdB family regulatory protein
MPIFEYKCKSCLSVFEYFVEAGLEDKVSCISCGSFDFVRTDSVSFYPKKIFCPHEVGMLTKKQKSKCICKK